MNIQKNTLIAAVFAVAIIIGVSAIAFNAQAATPSYVSQVTYTSAPVTTSSGGAHDGGCCTQTSTHTATPSYVSQVVYTRPATTYTPTTYVTTGTYTTTSGGCTSNCGGTVVTHPAPTCTITASPSSITAGQSVTITWSTTHATQGNITNLGTNVPMSGSYTLYPTQSTTFTGTFKSAYNQSVTCVTNVTVLPPPPQYCPSGYTGTYPNCVQIQYCPSGYTGSYPNCVPPVQYCPAGYSGTYPNCYPPVQTAPSCSITINYNNNNNYYTANQPVTISWNSSNAQYGYINQGMGSVALSGSRVVYPTQTTTYTGSFTGNNGQTVTCSATVNINNYVPPVYPTTPYVTLAAVPYTGLELGPVGTVVYWGFLALWCLVAAYLIVVKRVQDKVYASLKSFLFGSAATATTHTATAHTTAHVSYTTPVVHNEDLVDDFIMSQVNRARA